jgi:hypothetical protein
MPMPRLSIKALAFGVLSAFGGSMLVGIAYVLVYSIVLASQNVPVEELQQRALADPVYYVGALAIGLVFMAIGGYVAARVARAREVAHAVWVGIIAVAIGVPLVAAADTSSYASWYLPVAFVLMIPAGVVGGVVAQRRTLLHADRAA